MFTPQVNLSNNPEVYETILQSFAFLVFLIFIAILIAIGVIMSLYYYLSGK